jgi:hypothetical protein
VSHFGQAQNDPTKLRSQYQNNLQTTKYENLPFIQKLFIALVATFI